MALRCSRAFIAVLVALSAIPLSLIIALERTKSSTHSYEYYSRWWLRECTKWDHQNHRFIVSLFEGGVAQIPVPENLLPGTILEEQPLVIDSDTAGNASLGLLIDRPRNRLLVAVADVKWNSYGALAAYDMDTWDRIFLTQLAGPGDEKSLADDVAVDESGNAYVTDAKASKIWKVGLTGEITKVIRSEVFSARKEWYYNLVGLNGIVYHPDGFLLVIHTANGCLFKIDLAKEEEISKVDVINDGLTFGDGLELLSSTQLVVAGTPSARLVESKDGWATAAVVERYMGPMHRLATSATVKEGKVYLSHIIGGGLPRRKHVIVEAVF